MILTYTSSLSNTTSAASTPRSHVPRARARAQHAGERLARAGGFDLRIQLAPHDDHDEALIRSMLLLTSEERLDALTEESAFFASAGTQR